MICGLTWLILYPRTSSALKVRITPPPLSKANIPLLERPTLSPRGGFSVVVRVHPVLLAGAAGDFQKCVPLPGAVSHWISFTEPVEPTPPSPQSSALSRHSQPYACAVALWC